MMEWAIPFYWFVWGGVGLATLTALADRRADTMRCAAVLLVSEGLLWALWFFGMFPGNVYVGLITYVIALVVVFWPPSGYLQMLVSGIYLAIACNRTVFNFTDHSLGAYVIMWELEQALLLLVVASIVLTGVGRNETIKRLVIALGRRLVAPQSKESNG